MFQTQMTDEERAARCREMARETKGLAESAVDETARETFLDLAQRWKDMAEDIEATATVRGEHRSFGR